jgi:hypothetical protein
MACRIGEILSTISSYRQARRGRSIGQEASRYTFRGKEKTIHQAVHGLHGLERAQSSEPRKWFRQHSCSRDRARCEIPVPQRLYRPQFIFQVFGTSVGVVLPGVSTAGMPSRSLHGCIHGVPWQDYTDSGLPENSFAADIRPRSGRQLGR